MEWQKSSGKLKLIMESLSHFQASPLRMRTPKAQLHKSVSLCLWESFECFGSCSPDHLWSLITRICYVVASEISLKPWMIVRMTSQPNLAPFAVFGLRKKVMDLCRIISFLSSRVFGNNWSAFSRNVYRRWRSSMGQYLSCIVDVCQAKTSSFFWESFLADRMKIHDRDDDDW